MVSLCQEIHFVPTKHRSSWDYSRFFTKVVCSLNISRNFGRKIYNFSIPPLGQSLRYSNTGKYNNAHLLVKQTITNVIGTPNRPSHHISQTEFETIQNPGSQPLNFISKRVIWMLAPPPSTHVSTKNWKWRFSVLLVEEHVFLILSGLSNNIDTVEYCSLLLDSSVQCLRIL